MATFAIDVEEIIRYWIEVEAESADEAKAKAEELFFNTEATERFRRWEYMGDVNFEEPELVDEAA